MILKYSLCSTLLFLSFNGFCQIVNVESRRPGSTDEGLHGNITLSLDFTRNTADLLRYGNRSTIAYKKLRHRWLLLTDLERVKAGNSDFVNGGFEHVRYTYALGESERFAFEAFQQAQFNSVQKINLRLLNGAGLRWNAIRSDSLKLSIGSLPMYEYEETTEGVQRNIRQSTYLLFFIALGGVEFQTINYFQPKVNDLRDYRISSSSKFEFHLWKGLRFNTTFDLLYDTQVPEGIPSLVFALKNGVAIEF
ncbi:MAG: hypothetical protein Kow0075_09770 [Salibacteraceae bacterium]